MNTHLQGAVVVGVAESVFKGWALRWAAEQARLEGRALTLVNGSGPVPGAWQEHDRDVLSNSSAVARDHGEKLLARARAVVDKAAPGVPVEEVFEAVDPSTLLLQLSSTAHLLVLGSRGRGPVRSHLLGSVGLTVVRQAACPVIVHRPGDHPGLVHRGVLVAADATQESTPVLAFAFREASLRGLPLKVVHYVYDVRSALVGEPMGVSLSEDTEEHAVALAESLAGFREDHPDVRVTVETLPGLLPEEGLVHLSRAADLVVVGTHRRGAIGRLLAGSVSESVLERACGPIAVVPTAVPGPSGPGPRNEGLKTLSGIRPEASNGRTDGGDAARSVIARPTGGSGVTTTRTPTSTVAPRRPPTSRRAGPTSLGSPRSPARAGTDRHRAGRLKQPRTKGAVGSGPRTPLLGSTSFLVATGCPHGAVPRLVELPIEEYEEGGRRFVRLYLPDVDPDRDVRVDLRGSALRLRCERRLEYPDCESKAPHHATFDKDVSVPAGTTPDDVAVEYGEGVLLVSWPQVASMTPPTSPLTRREQPVE